MATRAAPGRCRVERSGEGQRPVIEQEACLTPQPGSAIRYSISITPPRKVALHSQAI